jgi:hypothetical protein
MMNKETKHSLSTFRVFVENENEGLINDPIPMFYLDVITGFEDFVRDFIGGFHSLKILLNKRLFNINRNIFYYLKTKDMTKKLIITKLIHIEQHTTKRLLHKTQKNHISNYIL